MTFSKITTLATAIAFLSWVGAANADKKDIDRTDHNKAISELSKLNKCDNSDQAKDICKKYCTGDGMIENGYCNQQDIWKLCMHACPGDWIAKCIETAHNKNNNYQGEAKCAVSSNKM